MLCGQNTIDFLDIAGIIYNRRWMFFEKRMSNVVRLFLITNNKKIN